ncbi:MAG: hypothetical protein IT384_18830 [Deltaproteobacteria bacterium]|nr:hypothetical protein [Deltaproteobacteria bacterium]
MSSRPFPTALPHGELKEVLPDLFFVTGTVIIGGVMRFSRNMVVVRDGPRLVLVNTLRLNDAGLRALDALGKVTDIIRLAGFHGMDDPFYRDRCGAKVWSVRGQRYTKGFDTKAVETYFTADVEMDASTPLPIPGAKLYVIHSSPPEGLLLLDRAGGTVIAGDCLQHMAAPDAYFNWAGKWSMRMLGFIKPHNVGPGWLKQAKPPLDELRGVLDLTFDHVLPVHGAPVIGGAKELYRPAIERACR